MRRSSFFDRFTPRRTSLVCVVVCGVLLACEDTAAPTNPAAVTQPEPPAPPPAPAGPSTALGSIAGFVIDDELRDCIIGARVVLVDGPQAGAVFEQTVCGFWDYGDDLGYSFHNLPFAQHTLRATADGYESAEIRATPSNPFQYTTMIVLKKK